MTYYNSKTRIIASTLGVFLGLGGLINHGIFEILQGNAATNGFFIEAIGRSERYWIHGTEAAFTIIHNYLVTGIIVIIISMTLIFWSVKFIQTKHGAFIFLTLLILLTLFGGGIGHIILFLPTWAYATRINKSLTWWKNKLPSKLKKILSKLWIYALIMASISWIIVMEMGIFGYFPGQTDPDVILNIVFIFLFSTVIFANIAFIGGFAKDLEERQYS